jgi:GNAT superfamily N-acetyltransferase
MESVTGRRDGRGTPRGFRLRAWRPADRAACLDVFESNVPRWFRRHERIEFAAFLDALPGPFLVVEATGGPVVACGGWARRPGTAIADLCWDMVARPLHGEGLGRLLVEERLRRIRLEGNVREVALNTSQHTVGFYETFGFVVERVEPDGYAPGLDRCDMRLVLAPA